MVIRGTERTEGLRAEAGSSIQKQKLGAAEKNDKKDELSGKQYNEKLDI